MLKTESIPESESLIFLAPGVGIGINSAWLIQSWNRNRNRLRLLWSGIGIDSSQLESSTSLLLSHSSGTVRPQSCAVLSCIVLSCPVLSWPAVYTVAVRLLETCLSDGGFLPLATFCITGIYPLSCHLYLSHLYHIGTYAPSGPVCFPWWTPSFLLNPHRL